MYKKSLFYLIFFFVCTFFSDLSATIKSSLSGKFLRVNSLRQTVFDENKIIFEGEVEILIDQKLHLCADRVEVDRQQQTLVATTQGTGPVKLENNDFIILTDHIFLNLVTKTGYAKSIRIHLDEGFISAKSVEKFDESNWYMKDILYTACDKDELHWYFKADRAVIHRNYFIKALHLLFKVGGIPIFYLPKMVFPIQGRSKSGFLIPKFSFDPDLGFGIKVEYYRYINRHCDSTFGIDLKTKRGVVFSDDFRWARASDSFSKIYGQYAIVNDSYVLRDENITQLTEHRYWVQGKDFSDITNFGGFDFRSLVRADFGTDKRICYYFFNNIEDVDDTFFNSVIFRGLSNKNLIELKGESERTSRKQFIAPLSQEVDFAKSFAATHKFKMNDLGDDIYVKKEIEDRVKVTKLPHFEWNCTNWGLNNLIFYRHDIFIDQIFYRQSEIERFFVNSHLIKETSLIPLEKHDVFRLGYRGNVHSYFNIRNNSIRFFVEPQIQFRSNVITDEIHKKNVLEGGILGRGAYRIFSKYGVEWALPEAARYSQDFNCLHFIQPLVKWTFLPKFYQKNWYYMDLWDRAYPINEVAFNLLNSWNWNNWLVDLNVEQGYDFYNRDDIFYLRRGVKQRHLLPFSYDFRVGYNNLKFSLNQEFEWGNWRLLQSQLGVGFFKDKLNVSIGYLYQHSLLQQSRELLSNVPHFVLLNLAVPLSKKVVLCYDGQFYAEKGLHFLDLHNLKPLIHRIKMEINGHCWGFYFGFEEKKYREYGNKKAEHSVIFALRLDSLGSFAKKFKRQPIIHKEQS